MRKIGIIAVLSLLVTAFAAVPALAGAPTSVTQTGGLHVCQGSALDVSPVKTDTSAFLTASGEVCGAGPTATATLSADAEVVTGCINPGSKDQQPKGLQRTTTPTVGSGTFDTRAGRAAFGVAPNLVQTTPIALPGRTCPGQQTPTTVSVTFTNVVLTITSQTGSITANFDPIDP